MSTHPERDQPDDALIEFLIGLGATAEDVRSAAKVDHLGGLAGDLVLARGSEMNVVDLARASGVEVDEVVSLWREMGLMPQPDEVRFGPRDLEVVRLLVTASELEVQGAELLRVIGASLARIADAAVALYVQNVDTRDPSDLDALKRARDLARTMEFAIQIGDSVLGPVLDQHLREAIERQRTTQEGVSDRIVARMAIGFVDLVGSTQAANHMTSRDLLDRIALFDERAFDVAIEHGGRIVKHVGDEVMFMALSADIGCEVAVAMTEQFTASGIQPRGGLAFGEVISHHGDYYGPVVNLASRLTDQAVPGEVLADSAVRSASVETDICFEPAGRRQLKGFDEPVPVFALSRVPA